MKRLTKQEYAELRNQYEQCGDVEGRDAPTGEHMQLVHVLNKLGYKVMSKESAMQLAENLLCGRMK